MKVADISDLETVMSMAEDFISASGVDYLCDADQIREVVTAYLDSPKNEKIVILADGGFIMGAVIRFPFGKEHVATATAWWVNEESRGNGAGLKLLNAFEYWAKHIAGCKYLSMSTIDINKTIDKIAKKNKFKLFERAYMKVLN